MSDITSPPVIPPRPVIPGQTTLPALGELPADREPIKGLFGVVEALLREPRRLLYHLRNPGWGQLAFSLLVVSTGCSLLYGLVVGSFSMGTQLWAVPLKVVGGLILSTLICLPSLYIFACLSGSRASLGEIVGLVSAVVALTGILLMGFAPVAWLFSQSTQSVVWMGALHLLLWLVAVGFGGKFLIAGFVHSSARSTGGVTFWVLLFLLVTVQMTTTLRPLVGKADTFFPVEKKFFLKHWGDSMNTND
jgi:hypothetical protein